MQSKLWGEARIPKQISSIRDTSLTIPVASILFLNISGFAYDHSKCFSARNCFVPSVHDIPIVSPSASKLDAILRGNVTEIASPLHRILIFLRVFIYIAAHSSTLKVQNAHPRAWYTKFQFIL